MCEILKRKSLDLKIIILADIILMIAAFFAYKEIFIMEQRKNIYAEASEKFVQENKEPIFKIGKVILYSSANAVDNSNGQLKSIDISQFTDMEIYIDNTKKSEAITAENTINEMYIDNIEFSTKATSGEKVLNYKNPFECGKYINLENYRDDGILFKVINTNQKDSESDYNNNIFFTDCSNPISLGFINKNFLTGCEVNSTNGTITFDGSILKSANVNLKEIEPTISFKIHITNNYNEKFICNLSFKVDLSATDGGIYNGYVMKVLNTEDVKYNFMKVSD